MSNARGDLADLEVHVHKAEEERANKEHQMRTLNTEIANKDELISKLNKEKKHIQEVGLHFLCLLYRVFW